MAGGAGGGDQHCGRNYGGRSDFAGRGRDHGGHGERSDGTRGGGAEGTVPGIGGSGFGGSYHGTNPGKGLAEERTTSRRMHLRGIKVQNLEVGLGGTGTQQQHIHCAVSMSVELQRMIMKNEIKPKQKLQKVWVHVYGVPYEIRSFLPLWAVGSILGATQRVDMRSMKKIGVVRLMVAVLDVNCIPDKVDIVVDDLTDNGGEPDDLDEDDDLEPDNQDKDKDLEMEDVQKKTMMDQALLSDQVPKFGASTDMEMQIMENVIDLAVDNLLDEISGRVVAEINQDTTYTSESPIEKGSHTNDVVAYNEVLKANVHAAVDTDSYSDRDGTEVVVQGSEIAGEIFHAPMINLMGVRIPESDKTPTMQEGTATLGPLTEHNDSASAFRQHMTCVLGLDGPVHDTSRLSLPKEHQLGEIATLTGASEEFSEVGQGTASTGKSDECRPSDKDLMLPDAATNLVTTTKEVPCTGGRSSKRAAAIGDIKIMEKAMNLAAKRNSLEPDSIISSRVANIGVSMGRHNRVILSSVTSLKNIEIDRLKLSGKKDGCSSKVSSPKINLDEEEEDLLDAHLHHISRDFEESAYEEGYDQICCELNATPRKKRLNSRNKNKIAIKKPIIPSKLCLK
uniref:DUF4283 domain-containing protein n=1 Tax=Setaria italica TaxID=4555 RepID=K3ZMC1_SETIT